MTSTRITRRDALSIAVGTALAGPALAQGTKSPPVTMKKLIVEKDVMVPMRDGVRLAMDIIRPDTSDPVPVILLRTPYSKDNNEVGVGSIGFAPSRSDLLAAGYAIAMQDIRGTFASEGRFGYFRNETPDGEDTLAWLAKQPWCGRIGGLGPSYLGNTQLAAAKSGSPHLHAIVPIVAVHDPYDLGWSRKGVLHMRTYRFGLNMAINDAKRAVKLGDRTAAARLPALEAALADPDFAHLPLSDHPELAHFDWWTNMVEHPQRDAFWREQSLDDPSKIRVPAFHVAGWYDSGNPSFWDLFDKLHRSAATREAREGQRVIIGPWTHGPPTGAFPGLSFGPKASAAAADLPGEILRFYDRWLKGNADALKKDAPIRMFVMGVNEWRDYWQWPVPGVRSIDYFLSSGGAANSADGDGRLTLKKPGNELDDVFLYNPRRPVPTTLPATLNAHLPAPDDQRAIEAREDVLCYTSDALTDPVEVIGRIFLDLHFSSSAPDTDIVAKLIDVQPDGRAILLTDGILRARYRNSPEKPELMEPGKVYRMSVDLAATGNVFKAGHRIRLEVSSSSFPRWMRNSNSGGVIADDDDAALRPAVNRVLHNGVHASRLILPVVAS